MFYLFDYVFIATGLLSCGGSAAVVLTYATFPQARSESYRLLVYLSLCDLGQGLFFCVYLGEWLSQPTLCLLHHSAGVLVAVSSFWWTTCVAYYVHCLVTRPTEPFPQSRLCWFHLLSWGYPLLTITLFWALSWGHTTTQAELLNPNSDSNSLEGVYYVFRYPVSGGREGWFRCMDFSVVGSGGSGGSSTLLARVAPLMLLLEFELPLLVSFVATAYFYLSARVRLPTISTTTSSTSTVSEMRVKMVLIPVVFVSTRAASLAYAAAYAVTGRQPGPLWLMWLRALLDPSQGFLNGLLFTVFNSQIRQLWMSKLGWNSAPPPPPTSSASNLLYPGSASLESLYGAVAIPIQQHPSQATAATTTPVPTTPLLSTYGSSQQHESSLLGTPERWARQMAAFFEVSQEHHTMP